jgi:hypothetical protein
MGGVAPSDGMSRYEDDQTQAVRTPSKSAYKAQPSKKDWANMEFEGWEGKAQLWLTDQVENDLRPPEIHWANGGRASTDEEQVAEYTRSKAPVQSPSSSPSYGAIAKAFGVSFAKSVVAPLIFAEDILEDPSRAVIYSQMISKAVRHPIYTAIAIDHALGQRVMHGMDTVVNGDNLSRAALAGSLGGGLGISFLSKAFGLGVAGTVKDFRNVLGAEPAGLTSRLNRTQIKDYLSKINLIPREQLIQDLKSLGLNLKGQGRGGEFMGFIKNVDRW